MDTPRSASGPRRALSQWPTVLVIVLGLLGAILIVAPGPARSGSPGNFADTGSLNSIRAQATQTLLADGRVLIAGGSVPGFPATGLATAEIYNPGTGLLTPTSGPMTSARYGHAATLLPDGRVLLTGGRPNFLSYSNTADIFDPSTGTFSATSGEMSTARADQTSTLLQNGKVLIAGGLPGDALNTAEVFDPASGTFSNVGSMSVPRRDQTATELANGDVLIVGGSNSTNDPWASAELYDPVSETFTTVADEMSTPRRRQTASRLLDGRVLVAGGDASELLPDPTATAEIYDPATQTFSNTGSMAQARASQTASVLTSGKVLVAGGENAAAEPLGSAELFDPGTGSFSTTGSMSTARAGQGASMLPSGNVLVAGGDATDTAEIYTPPFPVFAAAPAHLNVGYQTIGQSSAPRSVVITNTGTDGLEFGAGAITIGGSDAQRFIITGDGCSSHLLSPGGTCSVEVAFGPVSLGVASAALVFTDNAADTPQQVPLMGIGVEPATELTVKARAKKRAIVVGRQTRLVRSVVTDGDVLRVKAQCLLNGQKLRGAERRAVCDPRVRKPRAVDTKVRVWVDASCSVGVRVRVKITADAADKGRSKWRRTWKVRDRGDVQTICSLGANG